jgi:hypothetical protein
MSFSNKEIFTKSMLLCELLIQFFKRRQKITIIFRKVFRYNGNAVKAIANKNLKNNRL